MFYVDDSRDEELCVFSVLAIPAQNWRQAFHEVRQWRRSLRHSDGVYVYKELHAWKFVSGRGRPSERIITKARRAVIFRDCIRLVAALPAVRLFNAVFPRKQDERAFERLLNRMNRALRDWDSHGLLICDEGKESTYTRLVRRMGTYNPIPSRFGTWRDTGLTYRNIPIDRIIEDPFFKASNRSYFIQLVDFVAYSLLRRERQVPSKNRYGIHQAFADLAGILVREASRMDPEGIIRP